MSSMFSLDGKRAFITGGTSGIGLETTKMLRDRGAEVIAGSRRECEIDGVECVQVDVLDRDALEALFAKHHGFDYLVNAATGGARALGPFLEMDLDGYQGSFAKLWGYVNSVRLGVPHMAQDGAVVLFSGFPVRKWKPGFIAIGVSGDDDETFNSAPTNYDGASLAGVIAGGGLNASVACGMAHRLAFNSANDRPSTFGLSGNEGSQGMAVVLRAA